MFTSPPVPTPLVTPLCQLEIHVGLHLLHVVHITSFMQEDLDCLSIFCRFCVIASRVVLRLYKPCVTVSLMTGCRFLDSTAQGDMAVPSTSQNSHSVTAQTPQCDRSHFLSSVTYGLDALLGLFTTITCKSAPEDHYFFDPGFLRYDLIMSVAPL